MTVPKAIAAAVRLVVDSAFPEHCLLCGGVLEPGHMRVASVCPDCSAAISPLSGRRCAVCSLPLVSEEDICTRCRVRRFAFDRHVSLFEYRGDVRELLYYYKFKGRERLAIFFAGFLARELEGSAPESVVVPVPSRPRTVRARGCAAVELLARRCAGLAGLAFTACLARGKGVSQKTLDYETRLANLAGRIAPLPAAARLAGENVYLVDDIFTTGATAHECALVLKKAGAASVTVLTVAMEA
ncbi:MAG: ComF family protein [Spirochaetales bacterium]|nr:ComF family protein [Spirochaetales bacterium]